MLPARKTALIRHAWFAKCLAINKINLEDARMELRDFAETHAECPHCFQWRVDDDFLLGSKRWSHEFAGLAALPRCISLNPRRQILNRA
jgi:hypothetical protein